MAGSISFPTAISTKLKVYQAVVIPTLLYGVETWTLYKRHVRLLGRFHQRCLCTILNIKWQDYVSNVEVLAKAHMPSIETIVLKHHLRRAGHVSWMENTRLRKAAFFGELREGKRSRGAPRKRYHDQLKKQLTLAGISHQSWQHEAKKQRKLAPPYLQWMAEIRTRRTSTCCGQEEEAKAKDCHPDTSRPILPLFKVWKDMCSPDWTSQSPSGLQKKSSSLILASEELAITYFIDLFTIRGNT